MNAGEFAKKYGINYQDVRHATFRTAARQEQSWVIDFDEPALIKAVREELMFKLTWHRDRLTRIAADLARLDGEAGKS